MSGHDDLIDLFLALDRAGPGDLDSLHWALQVAGTPPRAQVLDAGCGTGADLPALLAARPLAQITAIDSAAPFIERVRARFPSVSAHVGDMANPPGGPYDLIWSAGAIYHLGVRPALSSWAAHLKPGGCVAFSDLCWRVSDPPAPACAFWQAEGLALGSADDLASAVTGAGWRVLGARWLGPGGWAAYYAPLAKQLDSYTGAPDLVTALRAEIALWRAHGGSYDYRLIVTAPA
ncbi:MAG: class I SAM-dependent methyltransferase [Pararhodobacter sp.]|nr:class I SAM-dependent methyltransferase [Pararhodobacter sp.]